MAFSTAVLSSFPSSPNGSKEGEKKKLQNLHIHHIQIKITGEPLDSKPRYWTSLITNVGKIVTSPRAPWPIWNQDCESISSNYLNWSRTGYQCLKLRISMFETPEWFEIMTYECLQKSKVKKHNDHLHFLLSF